MLAAAGALEDKNGKIAFDFFEIAPIPIPQFTLFVKKSNCAPLARFVYQFGTLDRLGAIESSLQVCVPESTEDRTQLKKKAAAILLRVLPILRGVRRARYR